MQTIIMNLKAGSVVAQLVDENGFALYDIPAICRGLKANLVLRLQNEDGTPYSEDLASYSGWSFVLANDWDSATAPQIEVAAGITANGSEVTIPLLDTATPELIAALGTQEEIILGAELVGLETGGSAPAFLLQFDLRVRNRRA